MRYAALRSVATLVLAVAISAAASAQTGDTLRFRVVAKTPSAARLITLGGKSENYKAAKTHKLSNGKLIRVTPARSIRTDVRDASYIGTITTEVPGKATAIKPGRYDLYMARMKDGYHVYAISPATKKVVAEAKNVSVDLSANAGEIEIDDADWRTVIPLGCRNQKCNVRVTTNW
jgi:hypothetical protein